MKKQGIGLGAGVPVLLLGVAPAYAWWHGPHVWVGGPLWYPNPYYAPPVDVPPVVVQPSPLVVVSAIPAAHLRAAARYGPRRVVLVLLRRVERLLSVCQGMPGWVDARRSTAESRTVEPTDASPAAFSKRSPPHRAPPHVPVHVGRVSAPGLCFRDLTLESEVLILRVLRGPAHVEALAPLGISVRVHDRAVLDVTLESVRWPRRQALRPVGGIRGPHREPGRRQQILGRVRLRAAHA